MLWHPLFSLTSPAAAAVTELRSGAAQMPHRRYKSKRDIEEERIRLGILPEPVQAVVREVLEAPGPSLETLQAALDRERLAYKALYAEVLQQEIRIRQQQEDEAIALVLLLH